MILTRSGSSLANGNNNARTNECAMNKSHSSENETIVVDVNDVDNDAHSGTGTELNPPSSSQNSSRSSKKSASFSKFVHSTILSLFR